MKIIWSDTHWIQFVSYFYPFIPILFGIYILLYFETFPVQRIVLILGILLFLYVFICAIIVKLTKVTEEGIIIGNAKDDTYSSIITRKAIFVQWNEIKRIKIINKVVRHSIYHFIKTFLIVSLKNNTKFETFIAQPTEFLNALKSLEKEYLLSKDSINFSNYYESRHALKKKETR
jgi:hypothetical protein